MYLSKIALSGSYARNQYQMHKGLWELFSDGPDRQRDFLFRVEQKQRGCAALLVQSGRQPLGVSDEKINVIATKAWKPEFQPEQRLRFFLHANPVKKIRDEQQRKNSRGEIKSNRVPLLDYEEQENWLIRKLYPCAEILQIDINPIEPVYFRKQKTGAGKIQPVRYQGILSVLQPDSFSALIKNGIGPAKAFGCGMFSLARV